VHFLSFFDLSVQDNFLKALAVNVFREIVFELYFLISCASLVKTAKHAAKLVFSCVFTLPKRKTGGIPGESRLLCFSVVYHRVRRSCSSSVKGPGSASVPR
jgi:hypothetical protein